MSCSTVPRLGTELQESPAASWLAAAAAFHPRPWCEAPPAAFVHAPSWEADCCCAAAGREAGSSPGQFCSGGARVLCSVVGVSPWLVHPLGTAVPVSCSPSITVKSPPMGDVAFAKEPLQVNGRQVTGTLTWMLHLVSGQHSPRLCHGFGH